MSQTQRKLKITNEPAPLISSSHTQGEVQQHLVIDTKPNQSESYEDDGTPEEDAWARTIGPQLMHRQAT